MIFFGYLIESEGRYDDHSVCKQKDCSIGRYCLRIMQGHVCRSRTGIFLPFAPPFYSHVCVCMPVFHSFLFSFILL